MSSLLILGAIFLAPGAIALAAGAVSIAGAAADLLTRRHAVMIRLIAITAAATGTAGLWTGIIVWISLQTMMLQKSLPVLAAVLLLASLPVVQAVRALPPEADEDADEAVERPALLVAGLLNAALAAVLG